MGGNDSAGVGDITGEISHLTFAVLCGDLGGGFNKRFRAPCQDRNIRSGAIKMLGHGQPKAEAAAGDECGLSG